MKRAFLLLVACLAVVLVADTALAPIVPELQDDADPARARHRSADLNYFPRYNREWALHNGGGSDMTEWSVEQALRWLKQRQNDDGSWGQGSARPALTGLALLCFLGHREDLASEDFGSTVRRGLSWLALQQNRDGSFADGPAQGAQHAIATLAMAEAYGMTELKTLGVLVRMAVWRMLEAQTPDGGWYNDYADTDPDGSPRRGGDTIVSGWHVLALDAAWRSGIRFEEDFLKSARERAAQDLKSRFDPETGFSRTSREPDGEDVSSTVVATVCLELLGERETDEVKRGLELIAGHSFDWRRVKDGAEPPLDVWFYATQAMFHAAPDPKQSKHWQDWNAVFAPSLMRKQHSDGRWEQPPDAASTLLGIDLDGDDVSIWSTALCCLMLETYYRYPPGEPKPQQAAAPRLETLTVVVGPRGLSVNGRLMTRSDFLRKVGSRIGQNRDLYVFVEPESPADMEKANTIVELLRERGAQVLVWPAEGAAE